MPSIKWEGIRIDNFLNDESMTIYCKLELIIVRYYLFERKPTI